MRTDTSYRFGAGRYIQEPDVLDYSGEEILRYGSKAYVIGGETAIALTSERMFLSFEKSGLDYMTEIYSGYPSVEKIGQLKKEAAGCGCDVFVGVGGGRIADLAKASAAELGIPVVLIPTSAATCAAFSPISVLYTPEGRSDAYIHLEYEVNAVLVDEQVMLTQPARLLAAGILDSMAKYIEIETLHPQILDESTTIARHSAFHMAKYIYDVLWEKGPGAVEDLRAGQWTKTLHDVVYINIALTGVVSALMQGKGQTALGHAFNNMLRKRYLEYASPYLHGELVAMGLLAQLTYNEEESRVAELKKYMEDFRMPCSLESIGVNTSEANLDQMIQWLTSYPFMTHDEKHRKLLKEAVLSVRR